MKILWRTWWKIQKSASQFQQVSWWNFFLKNSNFKVISTPKKPKATQTHISLAYVWTEFVEQYHIIPFPPYPSLIEQQQFLFITTGDHSSSKCNKELVGTFILGMNSKRMNSNAGSNENSNHRGIQSVHYDTANICLTANWTRSILAKRKI